MPAARVTCYEVGPRDGLQNEASNVPTDMKVRLIEALVAAGLPKIEATSFVSPKWIPTLADADQVAARLPADAKGRFSALVPNAKGLERAVTAGLEEVAIFMSASETHNKKNINKSIDETYATFEEVLGPARAKGLRVRGYVSTVWGCPYEGEVDPKRAVAVAERLVAMGCYQVSLGDTIGVGVPTQTREIMGLALAKLKPAQIALHMHDTRGTALANVLVGLEAGITTFDASIGGLGGCPYAPGAAGNLAMEDLVYMLSRMGHDTGVDFEKLIAAGALAQRIVGRNLPGKALQAELGKRARERAEPA
jgi:hydroxymethylglutaryl-CoA lyase